jgi:hypothetical protein
MSKWRSPNGIRDREAVVVTLGRNMAEVKYLPRVRKTPDQKHHNERGADRVSDTTALK